MSKLGGNSPSADTDKSNNLQGADGADGTNGTNGTNGNDGNDGVVQTIVGGTNTTIDNTDPANPIINVSASASPTTTKGDVIARGASADERVAVGTDGQVLTADAASPAGVAYLTPASGGQNTTKGDLEGYDTGAARIPVGTDDQVLTADSTNSLGVAWKDAGAGGGGELLPSADHSGLKPGTNFWLAGDGAAAAGTHSDGSITPEHVKFDFIYFSEATTTIDKIAVNSDTASNGGSVMIGIHAVSERGSIGPQLFVGIITVGTGVDTEHSLTLSTPWVIPQGHYAIAIANNTAVNLTNIIGNTSGNSTGVGFGKYVSGKMQFLTDLHNEGENKAMVLYQDDYVTSGGDLSAIDFNDDTAFIDSLSVNGDLGLSISIPIVIMRVASTTPATAAVSTTIPLPFKYESQVSNSATSGSSNATKGQWLTVGPNTLTVFGVSAGMQQGTNEVYRLFVAKEAATANEVESVVATSEDSAAQSSNMIDEGFCNFTFTAAFELEAGARYFFGVQRTDGTSTAVCPIVLVNGAAFGSIDFDLDGYRVVALNTIPAPGFDIGETGTNFIMPMQLNYIRKDLPQVGVLSPSGPTGEINSVPVTNNFLMVGDIAGSPGNVTTGSIGGDVVKVDFIFFPVETTITEVSLRTSTASNGADNLLIGLHPLLGRVQLGTKDFSAEIDVSTASNTTHVDVLSTPWVVPAGWYGLVTWHPGAVNANLTNIIHKVVDAGSGRTGQHWNGAMQISSTNNQTLEINTLYLSKDDYDASPDLTSIDWNDATNYVDNATANGEIAPSSRVPLIYLKVSV